MAWIQLAIASHAMQVMQAKALFHFAPQPNCLFNADANIRHGFAIFIASVGALRTGGFWRWLNWGLGSAIHVSQEQHP